MAKQQQLSFLTGAVSWVVGTPMKRGVTLVVGNMRRGGWEKEKN